MIETTSYALGSINIYILLYSDYNDKRKFENINYIVLIYLKFFKEINFSYIEKSRIYEQEKKRKNE